MVAVALLAHLLLVHQAPSNPQLEARAFVEEVSRQESFLLSKLSDEQIWTDPAQKAKLLEYLESARVARLKGLSRVLAKHLDYTPFPYARPMDRAQAQPAAAAVEAIGLPAVPALLLELRDVRDNGSPDNPRNWTCALICLLRIYEQSGHGRELARLRIELELRKAVGKEKQLLQKALNDEVLR